MPGSCPPRCLRTFQTMTTFTASTRGSKQKWRDGKIEKRRTSSFSHPSASRKSHTELEQHLCRARGFCCSCIIPVITPHKRRWWIVCLVGTHLEDTRYRGTGGLARFLTSVRPERRDPRVCHLSRDSPPSEAVSEGLEHVARRQPAGFTTRRN